MRRRSADVRAADGSTLTPPKRLRSFNPGDWPGSRDLERDRSFAASALPTLSTAEVGRLMDRGARRRQYSQAVADWCHEHGLIVTDVNMRTRVDWHAFHAACGRRRPRTAVPVAQPDEQPDPDPMED